MKVRVTIRRGDDVRTLGPLLEQLRSMYSELTIVEAPRGIDYSYSFPVVSVSDQGRHFGEEAVEVLQNLAHPA